MLVLLKTWLHSWSSMPCALPLLWEHAEWRITLLHCSTLHCSTFRCSTLLHCSTLHCCKLVHAKLLKTVIPRTSAVVHIPGTIVQGLQREPSHALAKYGDTYSFRKLL